MGRAKHECTRVVLSADWPVLNFSNTESLVTVCWNYALKFLDYNSVIGQLVKVYSLFKSVDFIMYRQHLDLLDTLKADQAKMANLQRGLISAQENLDKVNSKRALLTNQLHSFKQQVKGESPWFYIQSFAMKKSLFDVSNGRSYVIVDNSPYIWT